MVSRIASDRLQRRPVMRARRLLWSAHHMPAPLTALSKASTYHIRHIAQKR